MLNTCPNCGSRAEVIKIRDNVYHKSCTQCPYHYSFKIRNEIEEEIERDYD